MKKVTVLVPCYNEEAVIEVFYQRIAGVLERLNNYQFELLFINDGSSDNSLSLIKALRLSDERVSYVDLSRNFGKEIAMLAGLDYVKSDAVIILDADLQDPPEIIPKMLIYWEQGYSDVYARRTSRKGESFLKKVTSYLYYRILQKFTNIPIQIDVGDFRLLDEQCIKALCSIRESQRYTKGLFSWIGYKKKEILYERDPRIAGTTKWNYFKLANLAIEGILSFTVLPLRFATIMGMFISFCAFIYMLFVIVETLLHGNEVPGYPSLITLILFLGGMQLIVLGIIGEYLGRVFVETKARPIYLVNEYNNKKVVLAERAL